MNIKTASSFLLLASLSCSAYGANLRLPVYSPVTNNTDATVDWTPSNPGTDRPAFYSTYTLGGNLYQGISVGAVWDDYDNFGSSFTVGRATDALAVSGSQIDWRYSIAPTSGDFGSERFDYSIALSDDSSPSNFLTITLENNNSDDVYLAYANGILFSNSGVTFEDANYSLQVVFGATTGYTVSIIGEGGSTISYTDALYSTTGKTFDLVEIGTFGGPASGTWNGDGFITVVPEPSAALLGALGVLGLLRRRR